MNAAEGEVQQYGYEASFPSLINVDNSLAYIGVLKDQSGLVKKYYMVNVEDYGKVVVADSRESCVENYAIKLGLTTEKEDEDTDKTEVEFVISVLQYADVSGTTYVYMGTEDGTIYKAIFHLNEKLLFAKPGDTIRGTVRGGLLTVE